MWHYQIYRASVEKAGSDLECLHDVKRLVRGAFRWPAERLLCRPLVKSVRSLEDYLKASAWTIMWVLSGLLVPALAQSQSLTKVVLITAITGPLFDTIWGDAWLTDADSGR